ncbi:M36 family metallopeptidase [Knoellia koreensis]|uniref:Coagulation factor 5/8 type-like protein n=1 Tax=Knoellia koreensis TaxID=2730921 RepID=A0A849HCY2_9MICO|nr:M36 family metallopeptidase [Knoellia sp. DB2414S]NNM47606.1 coagulation factor 5/8 type-like protein [Knoellia sp. DB2414S]
MSHLRTTTVGVCLLTAAATALPLSIASAAQSTPSLSTVLGDTVDQLTKTLDTRGVTAAVVPTTATRDAAKGLLASAGAGARATWDERFGTLRSVRSDRGYLTAPQSGAAVDVARGWLREHAAAFGLTTAQVDKLAVVRDHELPGTGTHTVSFVQTYAGVAAVRGSRLNVAVTKDGRVLSYAGDPTPGAALTGGWVLGDAGALVKVAGSLAAGTTYVPKATGTQAGYTTYDKGPFGGPSYVKKAVFGTRDGAVAAYKVYFVKSTTEAWEVVVDATTGRTLYRTTVVNFDGDPQGTVYDNYPGAARGGQPRQQSFGPTTASPKGWVDPTGLVGTGVTTYGNNADSYANWSNYIGPVDNAPRPVSPTGNFSYTYTNQWAATKGQTVPPSYAEDLNPAATNLFFQHNRIHDDYYKWGFTETAGNFQLDNGGKGGLGGDAIRGLVQAGAASGGAPTYTGRDNAYMLTLDDGIPPWSGMFLWEPIDDAFEGPYRDGSMDMTVIQHEYSHGLSNRYVAGGSALGSQQAGSMGEGWGDWYALNHAQSTGLEPTRAVVGAYATGNEVRGIRNYDYNANPTTFGDIGYDLTGPEVHADGEIWTATLWDLQKALVAKYGLAKGSDVAARLVTDGMPLTAPDPSFLDARDGILAADVDRNHGENTDLIWSVFARRGAGASAVTQTGDDTDPQPGFDHPAAAKNGTVAITVVNATTGQPVKNAKVILGVYEARVTPLTRTGSTGGASIKAVAGSYPLTIQAPGFGVQTIPGLAIAAGKNTARTIKLAPNLASTSAGATVVSASSQDDGAPAKFAFDDTAASVWATKDTGGTPYNDGPDQRVTVKLAAPATVSSVRVSAYKATNASRFTALKGFTVQTSNDGVSWTTARTGAFGYQAPRPTAPDLNFASFALAKPVKAAYVRFFIDSVQGNTSTQAQVADIEVFGSGAVVQNGTVTPDPAYTDHGTITAPNPAAGDPTGLQNVFGVTGTEMNTACTFPPASQGADAWVTKFPAGFSDGLHSVSVKGTSDADATLGHDLDLYFLDSTCQLTGSVATSAADESAVIPPGSVYLVTQLYTGANVTVDVTAVDNR